MNFLNAWTKIEGGGTTNVCYFNLLNTMHGNGVQCPGKIPGIKQFATFQDGVDGNVAGLTDGFYPHLVAALKANDSNILGMTSAAMDATIAGELSIWVSGKASPLASSYISNILNVARGGTISSIGNEPIAGAQPMADYPGAQTLYVDPSRTFINALVGVPGSDLSVVIHKTGGTPNLASLASFFRTGAAMASTHFGIDVDGSVGQFVPLVNGAGGNCCLENGHDTYWDGMVNKYGNLNTCTISIEHIDASSANATTPTAAQLNASFKLVLWLCQRFHIPTSRIKTHASLDPINRARCPGNYPMSQLIAYVQAGGGGGSTNVQTYSQSSADFKSWFTVSGSGSTETWHCKPFNVDVHGAIRAYYSLLSMDGNSLPIVGLPKTGEINIPNLGYTFVMQCFERAIIVYDPGNKHDSPPPHGTCYLIHYDDKLALANYPGVVINPPPAGGVTQADIDALKASLATLGTQISNLQTDLGKVQTDASSLQTQINALKPSA